MMYVDAVLGDGNLKRVDGAQIALRFPEKGSRAPLSGSEWHTDGMRQGKRNPFSLLLGVALSDMSEPFQGNFTVFPGSHVTLHGLQMEGGRIKGFDDEQKWSVAADPQNPWCKPDGTTAADCLPHMGHAEQLCMRPGDIVLAHPKLAHRGAQLLE